MALLWLEIEKVVFSKGVWYFLLGQCYEIDNTFVAPATKHPNDASNINNSNGLCLKAKNSIMLINDFACATLKIKHAQ